MLSSSPSTSISIKSRSLSSLTHPILRTNIQRNTVLPLQRRWASDEAATQSEPEAEGATEAQHGDNSIAASADPDADANAPEPSTQSETAAAQSTIESATESAKERASAAASQVSDAAKTATQSVAGTAESLGAAAGFGSGSGSESGSSQAQGRPGMLQALEGEPSKTVYVGNLYFDVRSEDLKTEFERAGKVLDAKIIMDQRGLSKG